MREFLSTNSRRLLTFHSGNKHTIIIHQGQCTIRANDDIIWFDVAMSEWLRAKPCRHFAETITEHSHSILILVVVSDISLHRLTFHPIHQQYRKLIFLTTAIHEDFLLQILHRSNIRGIYAIQLICYQTISLSSTLLLFQKALHGIALPCLFILHFEHYSESTTATIGFAMIVKHWYQVSQLIKIITSISNSTHIF